MARPRRAAGHCIVLCGLPGSGKTTYAHQLVGERAAVRLCSDEWMASLGLDLFDEPARARVDALQQSFAVELVARGLTVVYESGGWTRAEREALRARVRQIGGDDRADRARRPDGRPAGRAWSSATPRTVGPPGGSSARTCSGGRRPSNVPTPAEQAGYDAPAGPAG